MMEKEDVIVFDEEYAYAAQQIEKYCDVLIKRMEAYSKNVRTILDRAIKDREISARLQKLIAEVEAVKPGMEEIKKEAAAACREYISEIDSADQFLY